MQANKLDGCPSNSFFTLLICSQCSDNDFGGGDVSMDVSYEPGGRVDLFKCSFFKIVVEYTKRDKKSTGGLKCAMFYNDQF